jgi:hypothetical protein
MSDYQLLKKDPAPPTVCIADNRNLSQYHVYLWQSCGRNVPFDVIQYVGKKYKYERRSGDWISLSHVDVEGKYLLCRVRKIKLSLVTKNDCPWSPETSFIYFMLFLSNKWGNV